MANCGNTNSCSLWIPASPGHWTSSALHSPPRLIATSTTLVFVAASKRRWRILPSLHRSQTDLNATDLLHAYAGRQRQLRRRNSRPHGPRPNREFKLAARAQIPLLTADDIDGIPDGGLVRYRGMVIILSPHAPDHLSILHQLQRASCIRGEDMPILAENVQSSRSTHPRACRCKT